MHIRLARLPADEVVVRQLFTHYESAIGVSLCFQNFAAELNSLATHYAAIWLAEQESLTAGCAALRAVSDNTAELKRLFVVPKLQGQGLGKLLLQTAIDHARLSGYQELILDTMPSRMPAAVSLYRQFGFVDAGSRTVAGHVLLDMQLLLNNG